MRIYLAGPLFTDAERDFNVVLAAALERDGHTVFLPQRDSPQSDTNAGHTARTFACDVRGLSEADAVVAVCDGIPMDDGTAWEVGYAYARGIPIVGLRTDSRIVGPDERVNLMIQESVTTLVGATADVVAAVRGLKRVR